MTITKPTPKTILLLWIIANLIIGLFIVPDFGVSLDESSDHQRANLSLDLYTNELKEDPVVALEGIHGAGAMYYGTGSSLIAVFLERFIFPETNHGTHLIAHYVYFLFFQLSVIGVYLLCRQLMSDWISLFVAILFGTQPVLLGHGFMNPKDIPMLSMFILTVVVGFRMVEGWRQAESKGRGAASGVEPSWRSKPLLILVGALAGFNLLLWNSPLAASLAQQLVQIGYQAEGQGLLGQAFASLTTSGSLAGYLALAHLIVLQIFKWLGVLLFVVAIILFYLTEKSGIFSREEWVAIVAAGGLWGYAISVRSVAVFAGGIVGLYALAKFRQQAILRLGIYSLVAMMINYLTWPFLWVFGFPGLMRSLFFFSDHVLRGTLIFEGQFYSVQGLPWYYLLKMIAIQYTEPLVGLAIIGLLVTVMGILRRRELDARMVLLALWFFLPILYVAVARPTLYHGFRQFLFITPPLFVLAGVGFSQLGLILKNKHLRFSLALILIIPGLVGSIKTHPLQYSYFNQFVGEFKGASARYVVDYWDIGWVKLDQLAREVIPPDARVLSYREPDYANRYFEGRYELVFSHPSKPFDPLDCDYALLHYRDIPYRQELLDYPLVAWFEVDGVPLYIIYNLGN
jgi:hypothetical protein